MYIRILTPATHADYKVVHGSNNQSDKTVHGALPLCEWNPPDVQACQKYYFNFAKLLVQELKYY